MDGQRSKSTVNAGQRSTVNGQRSTTGDDVSRSVDADAARADVAAREGAWGRVEARGGAAESLSGAWGRVRSPMAARVPRMCRSALDDLNGTFKNEIGAIFAAVMQRAVVCAV